MSTHTHDCLNHAELRPAKAYSKYVVHPRERRWWHRWFPPTVKLTFCGKCDQPIPILDPRWYR